VGAGGFDKINSEVRLAKIAIAVLVNKGIST